MTFTYGLWWATEDIPEDAMHVVNTAARNYGDLTTLNMGIKYYSFSVVWTAG